MHVWIEIMRCIYAYYYYCQMRALQDGNRRPPHHYQASSDSFDGGTKNIEISTDTKILEVFQLHRQKNLQPNTKKNYCNNSTGTDKK